MNSDNMIIKIITEEAKEMDANVISIFEIKETGKKYAIYTFNEEDAQGLVKIYASRLALSDGAYVLESITEADEWVKIKDVMKDTAKNVSNYIKDGSIILISAKSIKSQMNEPISVNLSETKAAKIGPNYKSGITNNYLNNVKDEEKVEIPQVEMPKVEEPKPLVEATPIEMPKIEEPVIEPKVEPEINTSFEMPKMEEVSIPTVETPKVVVPPKVEIPEMPTFEEPKLSVDIDLPVEEPPVKEEYKPSVNVDSILNKASYYQNIEDEPKDEPKENIIQTIGLEFMRKVSELAEYEKALNKKDREMDARERMLTKIEKEIMNKEARQKHLIQSSKDKDLELKRKEKELTDKETDLNRRILEFNKKISMFQQTFETMSPVD